MSLQYFTGKKASGYVRINDPDLPNGYVELETRQCAHCGFHGLYNPGNVKVYAKYAGHSNYINGICMGCMGLTCMTKKCNIRCEPLEQRLEIEEGEITKSGIYLS